MSLCFACLLCCSLCWSLSPIYNSKAGKYYEEQNHNMMIKSGITGFALGLLGTLLFIVATSLCNSLSQSVTYTYSLPIIFTTLAGVVLYGEKIGVNGWSGIFLIISGLYLLSIKA